MIKRIPARILIPALILVALSLIAAPLCPDELLKASGRSLKPAQEKFIEEKVEALRTSDHRKRLAVIRDLVILDSLAVPFLEKEVERGSNPIPVRCAIMTLSEINPPDLNDRLSGIVKGTRKGRDEKTLAIMGLGKHGADREALVLRKLLQKKSNDRLIRMAAAVALARMGDRGSLDTLLNLAGQEKEERMAVTFLLAAALAGRDGFTPAAPKLLGSMKKKRRSAVALGCAFEGASVLEEDLLRFCARDPACARTLAVSLGRYRSEAAQAHLARAAGSTDAGAAADAVYSLVASAGKGAAATLDRIFGGSSRTARSLRHHILLAAAEGKLGADFAETARKSLDDASGPVRSAAALALLAFEDRRSLPALQKALTVEKSSAVAEDILLAIALLGSSQEAGGLDRFAGLAPSPALASLARTAAKTVRGKVDRLILEERHEERLSLLSARWSYRFRDAFMEMLTSSMDLDTIVRREETDDDSSDSSGDETGGGSSAVEPDPGSGSGEEGAPPDAPLPEGPSDPGPATGAGGGVTPPTGSWSSGGRRRAVVHGEKVEWDVLHWFDRLHYFPDALFSGKR